MFEKVAENLKANGFEVTCFETAVEAADYLDGQIDGKTVGFGGSVTLTQMKMYQRLGEHNQVFYHSIVPEGSTKEEIFVKAATADIYLTSANGLAETGEIVNIDGNCNRVSAMSFGHKKVYIVIGKNKLAKDYDSALDRARNIAAPLNAKRLNRKTPCAVNADKCYNCSSPDRICNGLFVFWKKPYCCDFEVVLINENIGF